MSSSSRDGNRFKGLSPTREPSVVGRGLPGVAPADQGRARRAVGLCFEGVVDEEPQRSSHGFMMAYFRHSRCSAYLCPSASSVATITAVDRMTISPIARTT